MNVFLLMDDKVVNHIMGCSIVVLSLSVSYSHFGMIEQLVSPIYIMSPFVHVRLSSVVQVFDNLEMEHGKILTGKALGKW